MERTKIEEKVFTIIRKELHTEAPLTATTSFEELRADSIDVLNCILSIEDDFGITVDDDALSGMKGLADVIAYLAAHC